MANASIRLRIHRHTQVSFYKADFVSLHQTEWETV